jgi:hypothetical protein
MSRCTYHVPCWLLLAALDGLPRVLLHHCPFQRPGPMPEVQRLLETAAVVCGTLNCTGSARHTARIACMCCTRVRFLVHTM